MTTMILISNVIIVIAIIFHHLKDDETQLWEIGEREDEEIIN
jgi:hypothetical protein